MGCLVFVSKNIFLVYFIIDSVYIEFCTLEDSGFVCEPDEYALLVEELKKSGIIKDHRSGFWTQKSSFSGKDFVEWVMKTKTLGLVLGIN